MKEGLIFIVAIIIIIFFTWVVYDSDKSTLTKIGVDNNLKLVSYDQKYFSLGPFYWKGKNYRIYRAVYINDDNQEKVAWIRKGILSPDIIWDNKE